VKVTTTSAKATVRRVATIKEGPVVHPSGYRRDFRVETVVIDYDWQDGRFDIEGSFAIHLSGHWVKQNGDDAKDSASGMRPEYESYRSLEFAAQYKFLDAIVNLLRPSPDLSMMILNEAEVSA
jgi:hypothetical protein